MSSERLPAGLRRLQSDYHADIGVPATKLPGDLGAAYFVESHYEDEIVALLSPARVKLLMDAASLLRDRLGEDARLMLAVPWRLEEPIGPVLHVIAYTAMPRDDANSVANRIAEWAADRGETEVIFVASSWHGLA